MGGSLWADHARTSGHCIDNEFFFFHYVIADSYFLFLLCSFRNYVSLDILHRVIEDYFGYNVLFVENITDIDDKVHATTIHTGKQTVAEQQHLLPYTPRDILLPIGHRNDFSNTEPTLL